MMLLLKKLRNRKPKQDFTPRDVDTVWWCDVCGRNVKWKDVRAHFDACETTVWYCSECWEKNGDSCEDCGRSLAESDAVPWIGPFGDFAKLCPECDAKLPGGSSADDGQQRIEGLTWVECKRILATIDGNWHTTPLTPEQERAVTAHYLFEMH
jgi:hypothetical protein